MEKNTEGEQTNQGILSSSTVQGDQVKPLSSQRSRKKARKIEWTAYLFILPAFVIIGLFHIFPVFYAIYISLSKGPVNQFQFTGIANYTRALTSGDFWGALGNTFAYAIMTIPLTMALGLFFAYLLFQAIKGRDAYRTIYFLPYVISTVGSSVVWAWLFNPSSGMVNKFLALFGVQPLRWLIQPTGIFQLMFPGTHLPVWLAGPSVALVAISIFTIWQSMGYDIVIFLAGLTSLPDDVYEAARIDGANGAQIFWYVTLPLLTPTTFFVLVISVIGSLQAFNQIFAMNTAAAQTLGGPVGSTNTLTVFMFNELYSFSNYGYASAIAVLLSLIILVLTLVNFKYLGRRSEDIQTIEQI